MQRYFLELAYKGTNYHGWQIQPKAVTVQGTLEKALTLLLRKSVNVIGAGRTDTGVHAEFFAAHFDFHTEINDTEQLIFKLNRLLPKDIAVYKIYAVAPDRHARFSALTRSYRYQIARKKLPFQTEYSYYVYGPLDTENMQKGADIISQTRDFTSFSKSHTDTENNFCNIHRAGLRQEKDLLIFEITANRFLRNMVRAITGTLLDVGREKTSLKKLQNIIDKKDRSAAGKSVPGQGLFLANIEYPE